MTRFLFFALFGLCYFNASAQAPKNLSSSDIQLSLRKLNQVGSVLYIAAHPDDENTRLLSYLANEKCLRTAYLSITRGDGGQNLIGKEQGEMLGLIRTQELLAARAQGWEALRQGDANCRYQSRTNRSYLQRIDKREGGTHRVAANSTPCYPVED